MGRQRVNQSAVDFSQQMLITRHPAQLSVPVGFGFDAAFFPVQLKKSGIRRDDFCKRKLTAVCSHQTRIGNLDAHLI